MFGHCPCLCCFLCSFHCPGHQDAHVWFCSLLSSLKLILVLLSISSSILPTHQEAVATPISSALFSRLPCWSCEKLDEQTTCPTPTVKQRPPSCQPLSGFQGLQFKRKGCYQTRQATSGDEISHIPSKCYYYRYY